MIDDDRICIDVLTQLKASKSALNSLTTHFVEENILENIGTVCKKDTKNISKLIKELLK